jgi:hypothetical protein
MMDRHLMHHFFFWIKKQVSPMLDGKKFIQIEPLTLAISQMTTKQED